MIQVICVRQSLRNRSSCEGEVWLKVNFSGEAAVALNKLWVGGSLWAPEEKPAVLDRTD